jgi:hypothetical protein
LRSIQLLTVIGLLSITSVLYAQPAPAIPSLSADQVERLNAGDILVEVINGEVAIADTIAVVDAPAQAILDVLVDFNHYVDFMPDTAESAIVGEDGEYYLCQGETETPWPMRNRDWTVRAWAGPQEVDGMSVLISNWKYVPDSGNLEDTEGYWLLLPWGDDGEKTLVRYYLVADIGTWLPDFLLNWATENNLPATLRAIRSRVADTAAAPTTP